ncbi:MAG: flagellar export chaperone FliS [Terriglobales bacterium]
MNIQQSYREAAVRGASPMELVVRLYEQMIEDLRQAESAIEKNDITLRTDRIKHAILVVGHLQSSLNLDQGGKVAQDLDDFYNTLRQSLVWVQFHPSKRAVTQLITDLLAVREAWIVVERSEKPASAAPALPSRAPDPESDRARVGWQG